MLFVQALARTANLAKNFQNSFSILKVILQKQQGNLSLNEISRRTISGGGIFKEITPMGTEPEDKVTVVGAGQVGVATVFSLIQQNLVSELSIVDMAANKLKGELLDLRHGLVFNRPCIINGDPDFGISAGSKVCIVTAGARQREGESRLSLVQRNVEIFKDIIPKLVKNSPDTSLLIVSNPVDVLTYVAWKVSGLPPNKVFGSGTTLDSARLRYFISEKFHVAPESCHGWVIGEHGDSSVTVWSGVNIGGVGLQNVALDGCSGCWKKEIHQKVVKAAYEIIKLKGYTSWAIAMSTCAITKAVMHNSRKVLAVSINVNGFHGIDKDVYLSLPCVIDENGVTRIIKQKLDDQELQQLQKSASQLYKVQSDLKI